MAERQTPRGKYFLNRRDFTRSSSEEPLPTEAQPIETDSVEDKEIESKLKNLYDSLGTSFWDDKPIKESKVKPEKPKKDYSKKAGGLAQKAASSAKTKHKHLTATPKRARIFYGMTAAVVVLLAILYINRPQQQSGSIATVQGKSTINASNAGYSPLLPKASQKHDDATASLQYNADKKVFTYSSAVGNGKGILVSQQPMPDEYQKDPIAGLLAIASNLGSTDWVASSKGKVYLVKNESGQGQTAVFAYKNVLVLMRSNSNVAQSEWKNFVDQLE